MKGSKNGLALIFHVKEPGGDLSPETPRGSWSRLKRDLHSRHPVGAQICEQQLTVSGKYHLPHHDHQLYIHRQDFHCPDLAH